MKLTKPYWYHITAYSMEPYFVLSSFPQPVTSFGGKADINFAVNNQGSGKIKHV